MSRIGGRCEPISDLYRQEISIPPNIIEASSQVCISFLCGCFRLQVELLIPQIEDCILLAYLYCFKNLNP